MACTSDKWEKAMAAHSSTLAWEIAWTEEPGGLQSMGSRRVGHDWVTSLSLFTFMHRKRKWQPTPVFLPGESQGWGAWWAAVHGVAKSRAELSNFTFTFHFHALEKEMQPTPVFLPGESEGWGAWWAAVYGVAQSWTRLKWLSSTSKQNIISSRRIMYLMFCWIQIAYFGLRILSYFYLWSQDMIVTIFVLLFSNHYL